jgi:signal transduction histidine kinase
VTRSTDQEALRSTAARKERRRSLLIVAGLMLALTAAQLVYRRIDMPLVAVRLAWCGVLVAIALALPGAGARLYGFLLPLAGVLSPWLFTVTVWMSGGIRGPDFQYVMLFPLAATMLFQDEVIACLAAVGGTVTAGAALLWAGDASLSVAADSLAADAVLGTLALSGSFSFRRVRLAELATQRARRAALEQLALSEHRRAQTERMASLGQLAAGVAHEINNPLHAVSANVDLLAGTDGVAIPGMSEADMQTLLADLQLGIGRIAQIVKDLKEFSSGAADQPQRCYVDDVIGDALRLASFKLGKKIEVRRQCDLDLPALTIHRRKLSQVLLNLLVNAADALVEARTEGPWVLIAAGRVGDAVQIAVQDNGPGISDEVAGRLFEAFVTTKPIGKGTGLGLALSREYVTSFGGTLELQPVAHGARFAIVLPAASASAAA